MKIFDIYFKNESGEDKLVRTAAIDKSNAKVNFIKHRNLEVENIQKIDEWPSEIQCITGKKFKIEVKEKVKPKKVEIGAIEFSDFNEIIDRIN